nr:hypothetical protein KRP22_12843 [Phytophthora ramorum]
MLDLALEPAACDHVTPHVFRDFREEGTGASAGRSSFHRNRTRSLRRTGEHQVANHQETGGLKGLPLSIRASVEHQHAVVENAHSAIRRSPRDCKKVPRIIAHVHECGQPADIALRVDEELEIGRIAKCQWYGWCCRGVRVEAGSRIRLRRLHPQ